MNLTIFNTSTASIIKEEYVTLNNCLDYTSSLKHELIMLKIIVLISLILIMILLINLQKERERWSK